MKQIVKKVFKFFSEVVPDKNDMVAQIDLVLAKVLADGALKCWLAGFDFFKRGLYLLL
jgi:hypothetical protein